MNSEAEPRASVRRRLSKAIHWFRGLEPLLLSAILVMTAAIWAFASLAGEVLEGDTLAFDKWLVRSLRQTDDPATPIGPPYLQEIGRDATALGGVAVITLVTAAVAGYLWIDGKRRMMLFLIASVIGGWLASSLLKALFSRPRPDIVPHLSIVHTSSFPSGHSMLSAVVYLTLGSLLAAILPRLANRVYVLTIAILMTLIVGVSRVYLGVHYPTDVAAGWMAGLVWALACWTVVRKLQHQQQVESVPRIGWLLRSDRRAAKTSEVANTSG